MKTSSPLGKINVRTNWMQINGKSTPFTVKRTFHHHLCKQGHLPRRKKIAYSQFMNGTILDMLWKRKTWAAIDALGNYVYHMIRNKDVEKEE
jgi:hypothetical protein